MSRPTIAVASKKRQKKTCDDLFREIVRRRGRCEAEGFDDVKCNGNLQVMHLVSRRYLSVRFDEDNAALGCAAHHLYLTNHPLAHDRFAKMQLGAEHYEALKFRAEHHRGSPDYDAVLARLRGAA